MARLKNKIKYPTELKCKAVGRLKPSEAVRTNPAPLRQGTGTKFATQSRGLPENKLI